MEECVVLGSRGSRLALWQAEYVKGLLEQALPAYRYRIEVVHTTGDRILDVALSKVGDKGLFTKELERELLAGNVDLCVHSMKDMPTALPDGLVIGAMPPRIEPNDVLVARDPELTLATLPHGSRVATGSLRRTAQLRARYPHIEPCEIRGNVDSRIARVVSGEFDAAVLAAAGIDRLGLSEHIAQRIPTDEMVPAVGQGAIGVEVRQDDALSAELCAAISDARTMRAVAAERHVLCALEGGCQVPMGIYAREVPVAAAADGRPGDAAPQATTFVMDAFVSSLDGARLVRSHVEGLPDEAPALAARVVDELVAEGAEAILEELR